MSSINIGSFPRATLDNQGIHTGNILFNHSNSRPIGMGSSGELDAPIVPFHSTFDFRMAFIDFECAVHFETGIEPLIHPKTSNPLGARYMDRVHEPPVALAPISTSAYLTLRRVRHCHHTWFIRSPWLSWMLIMIQYLDSVCHLGLLLHLLLLLVWIWTGRWK